MSGLHFPSMGNALLSGTQAAYYGQKADAEAAEEERRRAAQPYVEPALKGDTTAMGKLAYGDPKTAVAITTALQRMDANQRAKTKDQADYLTQASSAILQANPAERGAIYREVRAEGERRGYDMSRMPGEYNPQIDPMLRTFRQMGIDINKELDRQVRLQIHNTPGGGGGPTQIDMPGPGAAPMPAAPAAPAGSPSASAAPVVAPTNVAQAPAPAFGDDGGETGLSAPPDLKDGAPKQPKRSGAFFEDEPTQFGYVQRGVKDKYGNVTPMTVEGGYFVYRNPKTNEHVLYKPQPSKPTERVQPQPGFQWTGQTDENGQPTQTYIRGGGADPDVIKAQAETRRAASEKAIPQSTVKGMQENLDALKQIDRATAALNAYEKGVGGTGEYLQQLAPSFGGDINNKLDPKGTQVRALIADIGSLKIHDRSGAAVTAAETPRLIPFIPKITDPPQVIRDKLANFKTVYAQMLEDTTSYYNTENGFKEYKPARDYLEGRAAPAQPATPDKGPPKETAPAQPAGRGSLKLPPNPATDLRQKYGLE